MSTAREKPLLRGVSHQVAAWLAVPAVLWLLHHARTRAGVVCGAVYGVSLIGLLATSGLYHRRHWEPARRLVMKRVDHSMIFVLIAGTYTPLCVLGVGGALGAWLLAVIWAGALCGIAQTLLWPAAPRWLHVGIYVVVGWAGALGLWHEAARLGATGAAAHALGGVIYTLGALVYARKRPDPVPHIFGYHEIFHLLVLLACGCLFDVVRRCVEL